MNKLERGFPQSEFETRLSKVQTRMASQGTDLLMLSTEPEIRYFTGYLTRFWESPSRPWFLLVPASGKPVAVIPGIGADLMSKTWIEDIRTWASPDLEDDGVSLLVATISELIGQNGQIALPMGHETHLRMPLADFLRLQSLLPMMQFKDGTDLVRALRMVKSEREIAKIKVACQIAQRAFTDVPDFAYAGVALAEVFRRFQMSCLQHGADQVMYLAGGAGRHGYSDVISPAADVPLKTGDLLMLDTGVVFDGYFCDYDRNFSVGPPSSEVSRAHEVLHEATDAAAEIVKPGATAADLFHAMNNVISERYETGEAGRLGHGLGMQLTEWPSLIPTDQTVLEAGMVLTLEPGLEISPGRLIVHEENIVVRENGVEFLTDRAPRLLHVLES